MRRPTRLVLAAALLAGLAACGSSTDDGASGTGSPAAAGDWDSVVQAANKEGQVTFYTESLYPQLHKALADAFHKAYPDITLTVTRLSAADSQTTLEAERASGKGGGDVYSTTGWAYARAQAKIDPARIPAMVGPNVKAHQDLVQDNVLLTGSTATGLAWNTKRVPNPPKRYEDLLRPEFKGRIGIPAPLAGAHVDFYKLVESSTEAGFLEKLAAHKPKVYDNSLQANEAVTSGEVDVLLWGHGVGIPLAIAEGAPLAFALPPVPQVWTVPITHMVLGWAKHPNAAQVLTNWFLTPEAQTVLNTNSIPAIEGNLPGTQQGIDLKAVHVYDGLLTTAEVTAYQAKFKKLFGR